MSEIGHLYSGELCHAVSWCSPPDRKFPICPWRALGRLGEGPSGRCADEAVIRFSYFADAASLRACGMSVAALQLTSPMRPFNLAICRQIQTALPLCGVRTIETQTKPPLTDAAFAGVENSRLRNVYRYDAAHLHERYRSVRVDITLEVIRANGQTQH